MANSPFDIDNEVILELIKSDPTLSELYGFSNAESEAPMADLVDELSQYSRGDDRNIAHVAPGDTILPPELLEADPEFADLVYGRLSEAGIDPAKRVVDSGAARRNPVTGAQEFDNPYGDYYDDYSFEDYYNDLLDQDYDAMVDYLRSTGQLPSAPSPYTDAIGGTGPQTDETRAGEPTTSTTPPATTPPVTTPPVTTPPATTPPATTPPATTGGDSELGGAVITPPATTPQQTQEPVLGIPPEIADLIQVGAEIPIPLPGGMLLPVIFGTVQDFIDWTKTFGVDPTGKSYDNILESVGGAVGDLVDTVVESIGEAVEGATVGRINEYVQNAVMAGEAAEDIIQGAIDTFSVDDPGTLPPSTGSPSTPGTPPGSSTPPTTPGGTGTQLPGGEEEDDDDAAPAETAEPGPDVDSEGVPTDVGEQGPAEPQGPPADDDEDDLGTAEDDILDDLGETDEDDLGTAEDDILDDLDPADDDLGTAEDDIIDDFGETDEDRRDLPGTEDELGARIDELGRQLGMRDLIGMLSQPGVLSQQVDVGESELADIGDLYTFESIFRTPEQEAFYAAALKNALDIGELSEDELLRLFTTQ